MPLPNDESKLGDLTLRQALATHRSNPACAGCHARFDSYGLVFEGYGPIGELRDKDLGGKPVDARAPFPGGVERVGVSGLQEFIRSLRQQDFLDTLWPQNYRLMRWDAACSLRTTVCWARCRGDWLPGAIVSGLSWTPSWRVPSSVIVAHRLASSVGFARRTRDERKTRERTNYRHVSNQDPT